MHATDCYLSLLNEDYSYRYKKANASNQYCRCVEECAKGHTACRESDRRLLERCRASGHAERHVCHAGLTDIASPIICDGQIIGFIILGQLKCDPDFSNVEPLLAKLPLDLGKMRQYYSELPYCSEEKIRGVTSLAQLLARHLFLENIVNPGIERSISNVLEYIEKHLAETITIQDISRQADLSKSTLYKYFHQYFHCTINEYINEKRLERSCGLLARTQFSVELIANQTGFSSAAYYSRMFKKRYGVSPLQYRKQQKQPHAKKEI